MAAKKSGSKTRYKGKDLKAFRSKVAKLKKAGVVSKHKDARKQVDTDYMRAIVKKFGDVLSGDAIAVKAKKKVRQSYDLNGIYKSINSFIIVPKEDKGMKAKIKKGDAKRPDMIETLTPLGRGKIREIVLPFKPRNIVDLAERIAENPELFDQLKRGDEQFAFRLFGHNSRKAFVDADEFVDHVTRNYRHLFKPGKGAAAVKHLSVISFRGSADDVPAPKKSDAGYMEPLYDKPMQGRKAYKRGADTVLDRKRDRQRDKKKKQRDNETPAERSTRLEKQRARNARARKDKRDGQ